MMGMLLLPTHALAIHIAVANAFLMLPQRAAAFSAGTSISAGRRWPRGLCLHAKRPLRLDGLQYTLGMTTKPAAFGEGLRVLSMREQRELSAWLESVNDEAEPWTDTAPSWADLEKQLAEMQTPSEKEWKSLLQDGAGPPSSAADLRLFDAPRGTTPRVIFYRDAAAWCPYCQKVWMMLEAKRVPYRVERINMRCYGDKPRWFSELSPDGNLPVLQLDGNVITGSDSILQALESSFSDVPMLPPQGNVHGARVPKLLLLERDLFNHWMRWLVRETEYGDDMMKGFEGFVTQVDAELKEAARLEGNAATNPTFFLGSSVSMVDLKFAPFLERMAASVPYYKGLALRGNPTWPHLQRWFEAMDHLDWYRAIQSDYFTLCHGLPPQIGGCVAHAEAAGFQAAIDGRDGLHWALPLPRVHVDELLQGHQPVLIEDTVAAREAAARILDNRHALVLFCLRALGRRGPVFGSMLADPGCMHAICDEDGPKVHVTESASALGFRLLDGYVECVCGRCHLSLIQSRLARGFARGFARANQRAKRLEARLKM